MTAHKGFKKPFQSKHCCENTLCSYSTLGCLLTVRFFACLAIVSDVYLNEQLLAFGPTGSRLTLMIECCGKKMPTALTLHLQTFCVQFFHLQDKSFLVRTLLAEGAPVKPQKVIISNLNLLVI